MNTISTKPSRCSKTVAVVKTLLRQLVLLNKVEDVYKKESLITQTLSENVKSSLTNDKSILLATIQIIYLERFGIQLFNHFF